MPLAPTQQIVYKGEGGLHHQLLQALERPSLSRVNEFHGPFHCFTCEIVESFWS